MTARTAPPILVVGAGPTGLVAALTLARNNVPVRIIEQEPQHRRGQRGAGIQPRTFEVFHFLRVPEIHERATPILPLQEHKRGLLEPLNTFPAVDYTEPTPAIPYYNPKLMGQPTLTIIREHLAKLGYTVELRTRLISFSQDERCVRAKVVKYRSDDGEEIEEDVEAAYLISADGAKGMIRKRLELTFLGSTLENSYMEFGDIRLEVEGLDRDHWHIFGQASQDVGISLRPTDELGSDGWQFVIVNPTFDGQDLAQDETALVNRIKDFTGLGDDVKIKEVMWVSGFRPNIRMVNKFSVGRAFVARDAAHVHSPAGGQGLNSGIQDAFNIAWKIALVYKGLSPASLLDTYTTERLPVIAEMLGITTQIHTQMFGESSSGHTYSAVGNGNSMSIGSNLERAMRRKKNVYMLGVNYRSSPIVVDEFVSTPGGSVAHSAYGEMQEGVLQAGDRAPDAPCLVSVITANRAQHHVSSGSQSTLILPGEMAGSTRMFDIFASTHHTIIIFTPSLAIPAVQSMTVTLQEVISTGLAKCVVVLPGSHSEPGGQVESRMSSGEDEIIDIEVLVRPDGVVGAIVRGVAGLERYFEGVFEKRRGVLAMEDAVQV